MSFIPNAREGGSGYKDSDLKGERAAFLKGYDAAIEDILCLEGNLEVYSGESLLIHYLEENEDKAKELFTVIKHWRVFLMPFRSARRSQLSAYLSVFLSEYPVLSTT